MSILDSIISATEGSPRIVMEQHDAGKINWVNGLSDPGEMIACGYLPEARRQSGESDDAYAHRLMTTLPDNLIARIKIAALKRANLDTSNSRINLMVVVGPDGKQAPWHRLGVGIANAVSSAHASQLAGLGWTVLKVPAQYEWKRQLLLSEQTYLLIREDTGAQLGEAGTVYKPIQNAEGFEFLDSILAEFGAKYETAGSIFGGRKAWMQVNLPKQRFELAGGDVNHAYAMFSLDHTGRGADHCFPTSFRSVCANTHRVAMGDKDKGVSIPHVGDVKRKITAARQALGLAVHGFDDYKTFAETAIKTPLDFLPYANDILDSVLDITQAQLLMGTGALLDAMVLRDQAERDLEAKKIERQIRKRENVLADIVERYHSERCLPHGTVWAGKQAIDEAADWGKLGGRHQGEHADSRQFESVLNGRADEVKQLAYRTARAVMTN